MFIKLLKNAALRCCACRSLSLLPFAGILTTDNSAHDPKCRHFRRSMPLVRSDSVIETHALRTGRPHQTLTVPALLRMPKNSPRRCGVSSRFLARSCTHRDHLHKHRSIRIRRLLLSAALVIHYLAIFRATKICLTRLPTRNLLRRSLWFGCWIRMPPAACRVTSAFSSPFAAAITAALAASFFAATAARLLLYTRRHLRY